VDPISVLLLASSAFSAIKQGIASYKECKNVVGDVKNIVKEIGGMFGPSPTKEQKKQIVAEQKRVQEVAAYDPNQVMGNIAKSLGEFMRHMQQIQDFYLEEERKSKEEVYDGVDSLAERALQRTLVLSQLRQMETDLREQMIYQSPPELGDLWTRFNEMREQIAVEQEQARAVRDQREAQVRWQRRRMIADLQDKAIYLGAALCVIVYLSVFWSLLVLDRKTRWGF
jgi:methyl-accepting chemotaxis protein